MKKYIIYIIVFLTAFYSVCTASNGDDKFINALRDCTPYNSSGNFTVSGISANTTKQMQGWKDNKCIYKETVFFNGNNLTVTCRFSKSQINDIVSVADAYYSTQKYANEQIDTSLENIQNNPIANVFNKYMQDPAVCTVGGLE